MAAIPETRLFVLTDISEEEPDDLQSLIRLLLYSNDIPIEGLVATVSEWKEINRTTFRPDLIVTAINAYARAHANLLLHDPCRIDEGGWGGRFEAVRRENVWSGGCPVRDESRFGTFRMFTDAADALTVKATTSRVTITVPDAPPGTQWHVILTVTNRGDPPLAAYRRFILATTQTR